MTEQNKKLAMPSIGSLFSEGWKMYKERFLVIVAIMLMPIIVTYLLALVLPLAELATAFGLYIFSLESSEINIPFDYNIVLYFTIFFIVTTVFFILSALAIVFDLVKNTGIIESYKLAFKKFWSYLWLTLLSSVVTIGGFLLGIIPGIVFSIWFIFSAFILVKEDKRGMEALLRSKEYIRGYWWAVFGRFMLLTLIVMVVSLAFSLIGDSIGSDVRGVLDIVIQLAITPLFFVFIYSIYNQLKKLKPSLDDKRVVKNKKFFTYVGVLGFIGPIILLIILLDYLSSISISVLN